MDNTTREAISAFLAQYETLALATEDEGQPYVTYTFFAEQLESITDTGLTLYATFITTSRKLANMRQNPRVGLFIGPHQPSVWLEATAQVRIVSDEQGVAAIRNQLAKKSAVAAMFLTQVPTVAVEIQVGWLRITNLTAKPPYTEVTFPIAAPEEARA